MPWQYMHLAGAQDVIAVAHAQHLEDLSAARATGKWEPAVAFLRTYIPGDVKAKIREMVASRSRDWPNAYHTYWGMGVRNALRENGFVEDSWPIRNLDNIYVELIEEAVQV